MTKTLGGFTIPLQIKTNDKKYLFTDNKKITISTSKKNNKTYRTYQINIKQEYIRMLLNDDITAPAEKKKITLYLIKKHNQNYMIQETTNTIDKTIELNVNLNSNKKTIPVSLPKNDMEYVKAYDDYLETLDKITAENIDDNSDGCFDPAPLKATISISFDINKITNTLETKLSISNIRTSINKDFIEYIKKQNNNILPSWLDMLITDWNKEYINAIMNLNN